jgi:uncharacterized membrane protein YqjE
MIDTNRLESGACSTPNAGPSISSLVGGIITDAQQLIRQEMQLARQELQEEVHKAKTAILSLAVGVGIAFFGVMLLCFGLVYLLYWATNDVHESFPLWAWFWIWGAILTAVGGAFLFAARSKVSDIHLVPPQTAQTMRENVRWIKNRT